MPRFQNDDAGYLRWLAANPAGYVLNLARDGSATLHRASCHSIGPANTSNTYTSRGQEKAAGTSVADLEAYARVVQDRAPRRCPCLPRGGS